MQVGAFYLFSGAVKLLLSDGLMEGLKNKHLKLFLLEKLHLL